MNLTLKVLKNSLEIYSVFGCVRKIAKTSSSFVLSVCKSVRPSVRMELLSSGLTDFYAIEYLSSFRNLLRKLKFH